jgi:hypothetical protein
MKSTIKSSCTEKVCESPFCFCAVIILFDLCKWPAAKELKYTVVFVICENTHLQIFWLSVLFAICGWLLYGCWWAKCVVTTGPHWHAEWRMLEPQDSWGVHDMLHRWVSVCVWCVCCVVWYVCVCLCEEQEQSFFVMKPSRVIVCSVQFNSIQWN